MTPTNTPATCDTDIAKLRHELPADGFFEQDGCICYDNELLRLAKPAPSEAEIAKLRHECAASGFHRRIRAMTEALVTRFNVYVPKSAEYLLRIMVADDGEFVRYTDFAASEAARVKAEGALADIASSDDVENALDPARNKRVARAALRREP